MRMHSSETVTQPSGSFLPLDQGALGSCTGNAAVGFASTLLGPKAFTEFDATDIYTTATHLDDIDGEYPPDDTGSAGIYAMKALKQRGLISSYYHCFGLMHTLETLTGQAVILGVNW